MGGRYGMTQTAKYIQEGRYEDAIAEASRLYGRDEENPEPLVERAEAFSLLARYSEAVVDLEQAIALDREAGVLDMDPVDDAYFSALLGAAKKEAEASVAAGVQRLSRYPEVLPNGRHVKDATDWARRLRGELKSEIVKER